MSLGTSNRIRVAIVGVGNCASSLIQGLAYYKNHDQDKIPGVMLGNIGGYLPNSIDVVAAFDVDYRKIGKRLSSAIYQKPNCTFQITDERSVREGLRIDPIVRPAPIMDGVAKHMYDYSDDEAFRDYRWAYNHDFATEEALGDIERVISADAIKQELFAKEVDILINYLPVGSQQATEFWANICLDTGISFLNCIPVFIASDPIWENKFIEKGIPLIGDDMRSQFGASILSAVLQQLAIERGHSVNVHIQQNSGGNTDFLNMTDKSRLASKKISKTNVITSQSELQGYKDKPDSIHAGPSEYVRYYKDNKVATFRLEMEGFGGAPVILDARLSVQDSPNSAGVVIDAIRHLKVAREMGIVGALRGPSAYTQKTPPVQMLTSDAREECIQMAHRKYTKTTLAQVPAGFFEDPANPSRLTQKMSSLEHRQRQMTALRGYQSGERLVEKKTEPERVSRVLAPFDSLEEAQVHDRMIQESQSHLVIANDDGELR